MTQRPHRPRADQHLLPNLDAILVPHEGRRPPIHKGEPPRRARLPCADQADDEAERAAVAADGEGFGGPEGDGVDFWFGEGAPDEGCCLGDLGLEGFGEVGAGVAEDGAEDGDGAGEEVGVDVVV